MVQLFDDGFFAVGQLPHTGGSIGVRDGLLSVGLTGGGRVRDQQRTAEGTLPLGAAAWVVIRLAGYW